MGKSLRSLDVPLERSISVTGRNSRSIVDSKETRKKKSRYTETQHILSKYVRSDVRYTYDV